MSFAFVSQPLPMRISRGALLRGVPRATISPQSRPETTLMEMTIGQKVRVKHSLIMYHYPKHRNEPYDVKGLEGVIKKDVKYKQDVEMSATKPYIVQFEDPKFMAHFDEDELEAI